MHSNNQGGRMNLSSSTQAQVGRSRHCPVHIRLVASPYPDGLLLAQSLRVLSGGGVEWFSDIEALLLSLQQDATPADLLVCDWTVFRDKAPCYCKHIDEQGMSERLVLVSDAQAHHAACSGPYTLPCSTRWLLRPWRLPDLRTLLGPLQGPPVANHTAWH